jgi:signal transduction histidine kinase
MQRPDLLDSRILLRTYVAMSGVLGLAIVGFRWPAPATLTPELISMTSLWSLLLVVTGNAIWLSGLVAWQLATIDEPTKRLRALRGFAFLLIVMGSLYWAPAFPIVRSLLPAGAGWVPVMTGATMLAMSFDVGGLSLSAPPGVTVFHERLTPTLRSRYEEQIRQGARQEERARLARDLHDAVKQQLFAIQTAAATVEARFDADPSGARTALTQVRTSAREALTEMEVMLEQLQAAPLTTAGLIESLKRAADATRFRTGADVSVEAGELPADIALPPGAHQAMLRFAQEALANVARHSRATDVRVRFGLDQEWTPPGSDRRRFLLSISDDGQGFDPKAPPRGMGLRNMSARASEAGGTMELTSAPGKGTTIGLSIVNQTASAGRYLAYTGAAVTTIAYIVVYDITLANWSNLSILVAASLAAIRFGVAAYRVRSWR